ncbi:UTRA domain-containing protein [Streptosporangium subroseum]|uniref:UTRA domain-containing protein n=1 Tax=Streptosporangium subroseum TaxID=106412 RepID=UPI0034216D58
MTSTTSRIADEDERARLGMDYAEAILIIRRTMAHQNGHPIEVTEVKAPANRYEIGYSAELADHWLSPRTVEMRISRLERLCRRWWSWSSSSGSTAPRWTRWSSSVARHPSGAGAGVAGSCVCGR